MSSDSGIYILHTKDGYRVTEAGAIENIYWWATCCDNPSIIIEEDNYGCDNEKCLNCQTINPKFEQTDIINPYYLLLYFGDCKVFKTRKEALNEAGRIYKEIMNDDFCPICEYGIQEIDCSYMEFPNE